MTRIELVAVENLKSLAMRSFIYESNHTVKTDNDEQIEEYIELQIRSIILGCESSIAKIPNFAVYTLPGFKMLTYHVISGNKERLFVASVFKNADMPNGKIAKK